ncbi:MAG TPA: ATP-binding protein [Flavobacteriales bacterium]|nr:ATP-binding protein [Flavobacteriales bacterium]
MKTKTRIGIAFFLSSVFTVILFSVFVYYFLTRYSFADFYKRLEIRAVFIAKSKLEEEQTKVSAFKEARDAHLEILPEEKDYIFKINKHNNFDAASEKLGLPTSFFTELARNGNASRRQDDVFFSGIRYTNTKGDHLVIVSARNYYYSHHLAYLRNIFIAGIIISSLLTLYTAIIFSKRVFNPVRDINERVKNISSQNLHLRLETAGNDEISELQVTFNNMLDRLETAFETQNNFISNASHELSTPLTTIIGETDVALAKNREKEEYIESLKIVQTEAERLEKITKSLLFLAQTGFKKQQQKFGLVRMDQLLWDVKETVERVNPRNKVIINLNLIPENHEKLKIEGNEQLLHLAINNIVSNGCKYSSFKPVTASIGTTDEKIIIVVKDSGIGIPEEELKYIYDPFFRASNTRNFEGYGIGLPLARNIVRIHKGELQVTSLEGTGTTVQITFYRKL